MKEFVYVSDIRKERLYYDQSDLFVFEAKVVEQVKHDDKWLVRLDKTAFYPTSGGQPHDIGWLGSSRVVDVFVMDDAVYHLVDSPCAILEFVEGRIDIERRVDHMQQHAGQHIISACFEQKYDIDTVGFHLGDEFVTIDLDVSILSEDKLQKVERMANQIVFDDRKISSVFVTPSKLNEFHLRHAPKVNENIRIVQIEAFDNNACGGTHPSSTGKVGQIKLLKTEKVRSGIRLWFVCGSRALREHNKSHSVIQQLGRVFSTGREEIIDSVEKHMFAYQEQKKQNALLVNRLAVMEAKQLYMSSEIQNDNSLLCCTVIEVIPGISYLKFLIKNYETFAMSRPYMLALVAQIDNRVFVQVACSGQGVRSANEWIKPLFSTFRGKGGGNEHFAQGSITAPSDGNNSLLAKQFVHFLKSAVPQI